MPAPSTLYATRSRTAGQDRHPTEKAQGPEHSFLSFFIKLSTNFKNSFHFLSIFLTERFEKVGDQSIQRGYIPFSYGTRSCIGNTFAVIEATVTFVHLFKNFTVEPVPGWKPRPGLGISQCAVNGLSAVHKS